MSDHYQTLGVLRDATDAEIKAAHRRLVRQHHPDQGGDEEAFKAVQAAYDTLRDPDRRAYYDRTGSDAPRQPNEVEQIAPFVVGAFDRATVDALKNPMTGLGRTDIVQSMLKHLAEDKSRGEEANKQIKHEITRLREMERRLGFTGEEGRNIIGTTLRQRIGAGEEQIVKNDATLALVEKATEHVKLYGWELDPVPVWTAPSLGEWLFASGEKDFLSTGAAGRRFRVPTLMPGEQINMAPVPRPKRRTATRSRVTGLYERPHTCRLDREGRQLPRPRGSWAAMERCARDLAA